MDHQQKIAWTEVFNITHKSTAWKRKDARYVYIGRPTIWGNPFTHLKWIDNPDLIILPTIEEAVKAHQQWLYGEKYQNLKHQQRRAILKELPTLVGKLLGCYCYPRPCHGNTYVTMLTIGYKITINGKEYIWEGSTNGT